MSADRCRQVGLAEFQRLCGTAREVHRLRGLGAIGECVALQARFAEEAGEYAGATGQEIGAVYGAVAEVLLSRPRPSPLDFAVEYLPGAPLEEGILTPTLALPRRRGGIEREAGR